MNILILNWRDPKNPKSGGAEIVTYEHAKSWIQAGHSVTWFTSRFPKSEKREIIDGIEIIRMGNEIGVYLIAPWFYLFSRNKFDFVVDEIHGIPFFTPLYVRKPKIVFIHEVAEDIWDYMYSFPINKIGRMLEKVYFNFYKNMKLWTDADSTIEDLEKVGIDRKNCLAINCPASNQVVSVLPQKTKPPVFIFVSRVVRMKGVEDVIRAFSIIQKEIKDATLQIVGDGDQVYIEELKKLTQELSITEKVDFVGRVSNKEKLRLMGKAEMLLLSIKVHAGWCLVVIEAASQGTPSVVYRVSGLRDAVKDNETGVVVKENTPEAMAREAIALFKDKKRYKKYQANGLTWAKSLTWEKVTKQSLQLIEEVFKQHNEK